MSSSNPSAELPIPMMGVRADLDPLACPPGALVQGKNIIALDGSLVPRPGHTLLPTTAPWKTLYTRTNLYSIAKHPLGPLVVGGAGMFFWTYDGMKWEAIPIASPDFIVDMLCVKKNPYWFAINAKGEYWVAHPDWPKKNKVWALKTSLTIDDGYQHLAYDLSNDYLMAVGYDAGAGKTYAKGCANPTASVPTWSTDFNFSGAIIRDMVWCNGYFFFVGTNGYLARAVVGDALDVNTSMALGTRTFKRISTNGASTLVALAANTAGFGYDEIWYSEDTGATWVLYSANENELTAVAYGGAGQWLVGSVKGVTIMVNIDEELAELEEQNDSVREIYHFGHHWIAVTDAGVISHQDWEERPVNLFQFDADDEARVIVMATTKGLQKLDQINSQWIDISSIGSPLVGSKNSQVVMRTFERGRQTWLLGTNGCDPPFAYHYTEGQLRYIGGDAPAARCIAVSANRVLLCGLYSGDNASPKAIDVSAFNNFDDGWAAVQTSLLGDTPGVIVGAAEITALQCAIYLEDAIYHSIAQSDFMGSPAPFRYELIKAGIAGPCSPLSILRLSDGTQVFLGRDGGVYIYDGVSPQDVGVHVRALVQPQFDEDQVEQSWGVYDSHRKLVWFFYPNVTTGMSQGVVLLTDRGWPWPIYEVVLPAKWEACAGLRAFMRTDITIGDLTENIGELDTPIGDWATFDPQMLLAAQTGKLYKQKTVDNGTYTDDGTAISVAWKPGYQSLGAKDTFKTLHEMRHFLTTFQTGQTLNTTAYALNEQGAVTSSGPVAVTAATRYRKASFRLTGLQFTIGVAADVTRFFRYHHATAYFRERSRR